MLKVNLIITGLNCFRHFLYILLFDSGAFILEIFTNIFDSADCFHGHALLCKSCASVFAPLRELIEGVSEEQRQRWERLWIVSNAGGIHPFIYSHPVDGQKVSCFNQLSK